MQIQRSGTKIFVDFIFFTILDSFRFQANESVQKSITNNIRYAVDGEEKNIYHQELGQLNIFGSSSTFIF